jgi:competence protein ComEC
VILLLLAGAWLCGVAAAALGLASLWPAVLLGGAGGCAGLVAGGNRGLALTGAVVLLIALAGMWRYEASRPPEQPGGIALFNDEGSVTLRGVIADEPEQRERSQRFAVRVSAYEDGGAWQQTSGLVLVTARPFPRLDYGDELELRARLETPPSFEGFDYREYLARQGIASVALFPEMRRTGSDGGSDLVRTLIDLHRPLDESLQRSLPEPESALARGILLGQRASIPKELADDFNRAGISHLVAISGWNVTLLSGYAVVLLAWLAGRRWAIVAAIGLVFLYAAFVGASPSVMRAAVMGSFMLGAALAGRPGSALTAVVFAGALLVLPDALTINDVAFQLSFAATVGIVVLAKPIEGRLLSLFASSPRIVVTFVELTSVTLAATLAVLPIIAATFGRVSLIALPANLLAVPLFPFVMLASLLTAAAGALSAELGRAIGEVAYLPLAWLVLVGRAAADVPGSSLTLGDVGVREALFGYALVTLIAIALTRRRSATVATPRPLRLHWPLAVAGTATVLSVFVWADALSPEDGRLTVTVLDVGQGDAILIETPDGRRLLVDGGPSGPALMQALGRELPASAHDFDLLVLTHAQDDHAGGLVSVLDRYDVAAALAGPLEGETQAYRAWQDALSSKSVPLHQARAGQHAGLGSGVRIEVLGPTAETIHSADELNDNSVVLRLVYGDVSFLLTGDIAAAGEAALLEGGGLRSTVLKLAHHGSDGSTSVPFLEAAGPDVAVISVGAENTYGHPSPSTLLRLAGVPFLRTDLNGRVRFQTDGRSLWVDAERGDYRIVPVGFLP